MAPDDLTPTAPALPSDDSAALPSEPIDVPPTMSIMAPVQDGGYAKILMGTHRLVRFGRRGYRLLPSEPRCKQCASPFGRHSGMSCG